MLYKNIIASIKVNRKKLIIVGATEEIIKMAKKNNGTVTTAMVVAAGFSRGNIKYLVDKGMIEKSARGVYILPEVWDDEIFNLQNRFKRGIYSHETALFLWDLTDRTPNRYNMTFPVNYNLTKPKEENIRCVQCKKELYDLGIAEVTTPGGNTVRAYNVERTLCDILRPHSRVDIQVVTEAFKHFITRTDKNIPILSEYAKILKVEARLRSYLEVLL
ncbi:MAG: type IV toxin-antitoxin system AbiEi family antitoxin domain-containing protein [Lachnospiraceae bacterium]|nr:type IV toxin-antitoxin system AbiEi family antitoxin domain-containing protein [Lachnospiraceae bacterium]